MWHILFLFILVFAVICRLSLSKHLIAESYVYDYDKKISLAASFHIYFYYHNTLYSDCQKISIPMMSISIIDQDYPKPKNSTI